ncbi:MAG: VanZ family protein [Deltaproteobacteria bacterium]|nr:VanZ family protein [Deltaproteobacteria bacterium]
MIFLTIPLARTIQRFVARNWGDEIFIYAVLGVIGAGLVTGLTSVSRGRSLLSRDSFWLLAVAIIFSGYTLKLGQRSPEEAFHFVQYGILGILLFRALSHRIHDPAIFLAAAIIGGIIGMVDEIIQWLTPARYWGLKDIWLNLFAVVMVQIAISRGIRPGFLSRETNRANLCMVCRLAIAAVVLFGLCLLNTQPGIAWYSERVPGLAFLKKNENVMLEYGVLYEDPEIGVFRSRLSPAELEASDRGRAEEAAAILDRFRSRKDYWTFLRIYSPVSDPFLHEARVHLFSRDRNYETSSEIRERPEEYTRRLTIAFRENQILEKYFSRTLSRSTSVWGPEERSLSSRYLDRDKVYNSNVSSGLVTRFSELQVALIIAGLLFGLAGLHYYLCRSPQEECTLNCS